MAVASWNMQEMEVGPWLLGHVLQHRTTPLWLELGPSLVH